MKTKSEAIERINLLKQKADDALNQSSRGTIHDFVPPSSYNGFRSQTLSFLRQLLGDGHTYTREFNSVVSEGEVYITNVEGGKAILESLEQDIQNDYLKSLKELVNAEIFSDFIEMAQHLLENDYKDASAVIAGAVLEEHLKQLASANGIPVTDIKNDKVISKKASLLNADLASKAAYNKIVEKQVTGWQGIRNAAAHGKYSEYTKEQVHLMIEGILDLIAKHPA